MVSWWWHSTWIVLASSCSSIPTFTADLCPLNFCSHKATNYVGRLISSQVGLKNKFWLVALQWSSDWFWIFAMITFPEKSLLHMLYTSQTTSTLSSLSKLKYSEHVYSNVISIRVRFRNLSPILHNVHRRLLHEPKSRNKSQNPSNKMIVVQNISSFYYGFHIIVTNGCLSEWIFSLLSFLCAKYWMNNFPFAHMNVGSGTITTLQ